VAWSYDYQEHKFYHVPNNVPTRSNASNFPVLTARSPICRHWLPLSNSTSLSDDSSSDDKLQIRQNHHFRNSKQFHHLTRRHLNLRFLVYVSRSTCWRRETRTATNECGKSFRRHPLTSTCVTVLWDAGSPLARWTLRRCRVWQAIKRSLAVVSRSAMYKLLHPASAWQRLLCKSTVPERTWAYHFNTKTLSRGISGLPLGRLNYWVMV